MASFLLLCRLPTDAVVYLSTGDPSHNTSPPTGDLTNSGWQWEQPDSYGATVIGPFQVMIAAHMGIDAGARFHFGGLDYPVLGQTTASGSDLRILWVGGRLPSAAPIYRGQGEVNSGVVFHGFGGPRGADFDAPDLFGQSTLKGWVWTSPDFHLRWGTNTVVATSLQGPAGTNYMGCVFEMDAGSDAACMTLGDSGGGVFLHDTDGQWKLAGVVSAVEADYRLAPDGTTTAAAVFDRSGLYEQQADGQWAAASDTFTRPGSLMLFSQISPYASWIDGVLAQPAPGNPASKLLISARLAGPYTEAAAYTSDPGAKKVTVSVGSSPTLFFRLDGTAAIQAIHVNSGVVEIDY